jgi:hypothetical protein
MRVVAPAIDKVDDLLYTLSNRSVACCIHRHAACFFPPREDGAYPPPDVQCHPKRQDKIAAAAVRAVCSSSIFVNIYRLLYILTFVTVLVKIVG